VFRLLVFCIRSVQQADLIGQWLEVAFEHVPSFVVMHRGVVSISSPIRDR
jgi:hypothetical protein